METPSELKRFDIVLELKRSLRDPISVLKESKGHVNIGNRLVARKTLDCTSLKAKTIYTAS